LPLIDPAMEGELGRPVEDGEHTWQRWGVARGDDGVNRPGLDSRCVVVSAWSVGTTARTGHNGSRRGGGGVNGARRPPKGERQRERMAEKTSQSRLGEEEDGLYRLETFSRGPSFIYRLKH